MEVYLGYQHLKDYNYKGDNQLEPFWNGWQMLVDAQQTPRSPDELRQLLYEKMITSKGKIFDRDLVFYERAKSEWQMNGTESEEYSYAGLEKIIKRHIFEQRMKQADADAERCVKNLNKQNNQDNWKAAPAEVNAKKQLKKAKAQAKKLQKQLNEKNSPTKKQLGILPAAPAAQQIGTGDAANWCYFFNQGARGGKGCQLSNCGTCPKNRAHVLVPDQVFQATPAPIKRNQRQNHGTRNDGSPSPKPKGKGKGDGKNGKNGKGKGDSGSGKGKKGDKGGKKGKKGDGKGKDGSKGGKKGKGKGKDDTPKTVTPGGLNDKKNGYYLRKKDNRKIPYHCTAFRKGKGCTTPCPNGYRHFTEAQFVAEEKRINGN